MEQNGDSEKGSKRGVVVLDILGSDEEVEFVTCYEDTNDDKESPQKKVDRFPIYPQLEIVPHTH